MTNPPTPEPLYHPRPGRVEATPARAPSERARASSLPRAGDADGELVRRMAGGDEGALGELYDRWSSPVNSLALRLLRDADEAEEVVEEAFWQVWRQASRYEESRGAVSTWLTTIARSRALDRLRARKRQREEPLSSLESPDVEHLAGPAGGDEDPLHEAEQSEQRAIVASALRALPAEQRETIELAYFGGLSQSEIAERTGQPLGTVKTRVRLAMEKLRAQLAALRGVAR